MDQPDRNSRSFNSKKFIVAKGDKEEEDFMGSRMVLRGGGVGILKLIFVWNLGND